MKQIFCLYILIFITGLKIPSFAQTRLTGEEAVNAALKNSPLLKASSLGVQRQKQLQGTGFNLANPDITIESPTGTFMTAGVLQSFEFPTVYIKQGQLARQKTSLAERARAVTESEVKLMVRSAYLDLQYSLQLLEHLAKQDSVYLKIANAAERQFNAGQIDFVEKTFASTRYGEIHNKLMQAAAGAMTAMEQLRIYTGINDSIVVSSFMQFDPTPAITGMYADSTSVMQTPLMQYQQQAEAVAKKELQLERNKALPGFSFGYMNQGEKDTEFRYRLRAGINIPLWFWQYSSSIRAAKTDMEIAGQNTIAEKQNLSLRLQEVRSAILRTRSALDYYVNMGMKQADDLISASGRMFAAGEKDYTSYLMTITGAYDIGVKYLETLREYNQAILNLNYINGQ
jgi:outer membrane protein, heavy metal efflux system